jgi:hypothetical protein
MSDATKTETKPKLYALLGEHTPIVRVKHSTSVSNFIPVTVLPKGFKNTHAVALVPLTQEQIEAFQLGS